MEMSLKMLITDTRVRFSPPVKVSEKDVVEAIKHVKALQKIGFDIGFRMKSNDPEYK